MSFFTSFIPVLITNPFIPDLIKEESHGMANMLRSNMINLAYLGAYGLLLLNSTNLAIFDASVLFPLMSLLLLISVFVIKIGMKDVIKEGLQQVDN